MSINLWNRKKRVDIRGTVGVVCAWNKILSRGEAPHMARKGTRCTSCRKKPRRPNQRTCLPCHATLMRKYRAEKKAAA